MREQEFYMRRALELAQLGMGYARPNPMVGAVIVHQGRIISEGYHHRAGQPHAEVMAIRSVKQPELLPESSIYVSLEPCSHYGKTPPCSELIIAKRIPRVYVAMYDPFPLVSGRGVQMLRNAGLEVEVGIFEAEARELNKHFIMAHTQGRPYVTLKWAQTADAFIDRLRTSPAEAPLQISSPLRRRWVHRLRMQHQAIMVGTCTAYLDNPRLDTRYYYGQNPLRIFIDRKLSLPRDLHLYDASIPSLVLCEKVPEGYTESGSIEYETIDFSEPLPPQLFSILQRRSVQSLLVEGGAKLLQTFIDLNAYDAVELERSSKTIGSGLPAPKLSF